MTDQYADVLARDVLDAAQEWCRRTGLGPEDTNLRLVWMDNGTVELWDEYRTKVAGPYRVTVLVEPAESWEQVTWSHVALRAASTQRPEMYVELAGVRAQVLSAVTSRWHVKPGTGDASWNPPVAMEHDVVTVRLQVDGAPESKVYELPPNGVVMLLTGSPVGPAVAALANEFSMEVIPDES